MTRRKGLFGISPGLLFVGILAVTLVGGAIFAFTQQQEQAAVTPTVQADGEFDQALLAQSDLDSPFANMNTFDNVTVDSDAATGTADVLDQASMAWNVDNGTDLGLEEATAVGWFETDGRINDAAVELTDQVDGSTYTSDGVTFKSIEFYDYGAAVDQDSLSAGETGVEFTNVDETAAEAELGDLQEGEYAVVPTFKFASGETAPSSESQSDTLSTMTIDGSTDGDVDEINSLDFNTWTIADGQ